MNAVDRFDVGTIYGLAQLGFLVKIDVRKDPLLGLQDSLSVVGHSSLVDVC